MARRSVGTTVFGGMIVATAFGIFVIPMLFVTFIKRRENSMPNVIPNWKKGRLFLPDRRKGKKKRPFYGRFFI